MKKLLIFALFFSLTASAQDKKDKDSLSAPLSKEEEMKENQFAPYVFSVDEKEADMSLGVNNALLLYIPNASVKEVEKGWKDYLKNTKAKTKDSKGEISSIAATIPSVSKNPLDLYARTETYNTGTNLMVFIDAGENFISKAKFPMEFESASTYLKNFGLYIHQQQVEEELDKEEEALKRLEKEHKKLVNQNEGFHNDIERYKKLIKEAEDNIVKNLKDQESNKNDQKNKGTDIDYVKWKLKSFPTY